jgi:predicted DNA-binding transcriptional regulator AlpA
MSDKPPTKLIRYADLHERGIVSNWVRLRRLQETEGFPKGFLLSQACRVWIEAEVEAWLADQRARYEAAEAADPNFTTHRGEAARAARAAKLDKLAAAHAAKATKATKATGAAKATKAASTEAA